MDCDCTVLVEESELDALFREDFYVPLSATKPAALNQDSGDKPSVGGMDGKEVLEPPVAVSKGTLLVDIIDTNVRQVLDELIAEVRGILNREAFEDIATQIAELRVMEASKYWEEGMIAKSDIPYERYLAVAAAVHGTGGTDAV